jgi:FtsH-binding integral membrane protein
LEKTSILLSLIIDGLNILLYNINIINHKEFKMLYSGFSRSAAEINTAMGRVYGHMGLAVVVSMLVSMMVSSSPALMALLFGTALKWVIMFLPLVAILIAGFAYESMSKTQCQIFLHGFAAIMGLSFSTIFIVYNLGSIVSAFMSAAVLFAVMSGYGYFTKRSLDSLGQFMFIGLIAIIIASIINIFIGSTVAQMVISALAIIIFLGLTAYDTQKIREMVSYEEDGKMEVWGALTLYLDFINLFLSLLQLFGERK